MTYRIIIIVFLSLILIIGLFWVLETGRKIYEWKISVDLQLQALTASANQLNKFSVENKNVRVEMYQEFLQMLQQAQQTQQTLPLKKK